MADLPVMPLYTDALVADTTHLTASEFGAYMLILIAMWRAGGSLPDDEALIRRVSRIRENHWAQSRDRIFALLSRGDGRVTQKRLQAEFERSTQRHERRASAGRKGGKKRAEAAETGSSVGTPYRTPSQGIPAGLPDLDDKSLKTLQAAQALLPDRLKQTGKQNGGNAALNHIHISKKEREAIASPKTEGIAASAKPRRGTRLAEDWKPTAGDWAFATGKGCSPARIEREAEGFRNYWLGRAGAGGTKLDWSATWRNWILTALDRRPEPKAPSGGTGGWDLPAWGAGGPKQ